MFSHLSEAAIDVNFLTPFPHAHAIKCHYFSTLLSLSHCFPALPHCHLRSSFMGTHKDNDKHHAPTPGQLQAFVSRSTASQTFHLRASLMALQTEWQGRSMFKTREKLKLTQLAVTLLEAEAHGKSVWIINKRFLPYITQRIRLDDYRESFWLSRDNTYAREFWRSGLFPSMNYTISCFSFDLLKPDKPQRNIMDTAAQSLPLDTV